MNLITLIAASLPLPEVSFAPVSDQDHFAVVCYAEYSVVYCSDFPAQTETKASDKKPKT